ncbi:MAG TPA: serine hydrolase domain-containing protein [Chitinophagaceae bacterium]|jgi:CubicO group peptidase (beta-lactamase class C family)|nr:serine hydrolase domain-containing protein [Chitinophagaceae bacterium]
MKKAFALLLLAVVFFSCNQQTASTAKERSQFDSSYQPAVFTDPDRLEKIKKLFPAIDSLYCQHAEKNHFPGIAFGIVVDGKLVYTGNYGYTDIGKKIPVTSSSLFRIASMSKSFTAMAILKLRDEGMLGLDDPASKYIPELKNLKYPTADAPEITIRHLLTHGAGFPEDNPWGDRQLADTDKDLLEFIGKQISFSNPPGLAYEYSNLGFALLGKIVTNVSGKRYQDYIKENIWLPLGMKTSEWEYSNVAPDKLAHGYRWLNEKWNEEQLLHDTPDGSWGAMGSMISSIEEFGNYMAFHLSAWPPSNATDKGPVKRSSIREMHYPWRVHSLLPEFKYADGRICVAAGAYCYGLGWLKDCDNKVYISHSGGLPGFGSQWRIMPDYGIGVVAFANRTYAPMGSINLQVLDTIIKTAGLQPRQLPPSGTLEQRKKELVKLLPDWNNAEQSGIFAENFFPDYPMDTLKKYARDLYAKAGKIVSVKEVKAENQLRGTFILEGEQTDIEIYFTLSPENPPRIQEYRIRELVKKKPL